MFQICIHDLVNQFKISILKFSAFDDLNFKFAMNFTKYLFIVIVFYV